MRTGKSWHRRLATSLAIVGFLSLLPIEPASAQPRAPTQVRVEGYAESAPEGVRPRTTWTLDLNGTEKVFALSRLVVLSVGAPTSSSILSQMRTQRGTVRVVGSEENLKSLAEAKAEQPFSITGDLRWTGGRSSLMVNGVTPGIDSK